LRIADCGLRNGNWGEEWADANQEPHPEDREQASEDFIPQSAFRNSKSSEAVRIPKTFQVEVELS